MCGDWGDLYIIYSFLEIMKTSDDIMGYNRVCSVPVELILY